MKCPERERLFALAHRMLEGREEAEARAHVEACSRCRQMVAEYQQLDALLGEWKPAEPSPWFDAGVRRAIAADQAKGTVGRFFSLRWARGLALASVAVLVGVGVLAIRRTLQPPNFPQPSANLKATQPASKKESPGQVAKEEFHRPAPAERPQAAEMAKNQPEPAGVERVRAAASQPSAGMVEAGHLSAEMAKTQPPPASNAQEQAATASQPSPEIGEAGQLPVGMLKTQPAPALNAQDRLEARQQPVLMGKGLAPTMVASGAGAEAKDRLTLQMADELSSADDDLQAIEDDEMLANFGVLSELPKGAKKVDD